MKRTGDGNKREKLKNNNKMKKTKDENKREKLHGGSKSSIEFYINWSETNTSIYR